MTDAERLANLESTVAFQDQTLLELNEVIVRLQGQVDRLEASVRHLLEQGAPPLPDSSDEPPPPHY